MKKNGYFLRYFSLFFSLVFLSISISCFGLSGPGADVKERTRITTSQPYYLSGESVFYAVFLFNAEPGQSTVLSRILIFEFLDKNGKLLKRNIHKMDNGLSPGSLDLADTLSTGWYWLRAYTRFQVDYTEELIHYYPIFIVNPGDIDDPDIINDWPESFEDSLSKDHFSGKMELMKEGGKITVELNTDRSDYTIRDTVNLKVRIIDNKGNPVRSGYSISVSNSDQFFQNSSGLQNIPGTASLTDENAQADVPEYDPQRELRLEGKLMDPKNGELLSFRSIALTQTGKNPGFTLKFTDREGYFEFLDLNFPNRENKLVLNTGDEESITFTGEIVQPSFTPPVLTISNYQQRKFKWYLSKRQLEAKFKKFYAATGSEKITNQEVMPVNNLRIYDHPDLSYHIDDYVELDDMSEVILELLPNVKIFRENEKTRIRIYHHGNPDMFPDPLFLVNGRIVKDNDFILNMDNRNVYKIEILYKKSSLKPFGPLGIGGVVAIYTKTPLSIPYGLEVEFDGYHVPDRMVLQTNSNSPGFENIPDFNPVIYWNPRIRTSDDAVTEVQFMTNDLTGEYYITVEGISERSIPFYKTKIISVEKPSVP